MPHKPDAQTEPDLSPRRLQGELLRTARSVWMHAVPLQEFINDELVSLSAGDDTLVEHKQSLGAFAEFIFHYNAHWEFVAQWVQTSSSTPIERYRATVAYDVILGVNPFSPEEFQALVAVCQSGDPEATTTYTERLSSNDSASGLLDKWNQLFVVREDRGLSDAQAIALAAGDLRNVLKPFVHPTAQEIDKRMGERT